MDDGDGVPVIVSVTWSDVPEIESSILQRHDTSGTRAMTSIDRYVHDCVVAAMVRKVPGFRGANRVWREVRILPQPLLRLWILEAGV